MDAWGPVTIFLGYAQRHLVTYNVNSFERYPCYVAANQGEVITHPLPSVVLAARDWL